MKSVVLILLMGCSAYSMKIQTNFSLHIVSDSEAVRTSRQRLPPSYQVDPVHQSATLNENNLKPKTINEPFDAYKNVPGIPQGDTGTTTINKYIFNDYPAVEELERLNFIRKAMKAVMGTSQLCDERQPNNYRVPGSACFEDCSCDVSCHETGDCCPDVQHKLIEIEFPRDNQQQYETPQPVCTIINSKLNGQQPNKALDQTNSLLQKTMVSPQNNAILQDSKTTNEAADMSKDTRIGSKINGDRFALTSETETIHYPHYLVISSCPRGFSNQKTIEKCQQETGTSILDIIRVYDRFTHKIYKNEHCAICHNKQQTVPWTVESDCVELYTNSCLTSKLMDLLRMTQKGHCKIEFTPPMYRDLSSLQCHPEKSRNGIIASCNATGLWMEQDKRIADLCIQPHTTSHFYQHMGGKLLVYRNMFCYMCNQPTDGVTSPSPICPITASLQKTGRQGIPFPNVHIIMDVDQFETDENTRNSIKRFANHTTDVSEFDDQTHCDRDEFWDTYMKKCRKLICPLDEIPIQKMCIEKQRIVEGLIFSTQLLITMARDDHISMHDSPSSTLTSLFESIHAVLDNHLRLSLSHCITKHAEVLAKTENEKIHFFFMKLKIANTLECSVHMLIDIFDQLATKKTLHDAGLLDMYNISMLEIGLEFRTLSHQDFEFQHVLLHIPHDNSNEIILEPLFNCPRVKLSMDEYNQSINNNVIEKLDHQDFKLQYSAETNTVDICLMPYLKKWILSMYPSRQQKESISKIDTTISMIATLTSMISTMITLITYGLFSELRFVPGKLFMILCVNLLLAQLFFAFGKNSGYPLFWCQFVGIGIHFFWLATIFSMNSCMLLMVRSIKSPLEQRNRVIMQSRSISKASNYIIFSYTVPLLIVLSTLITAWIKKEPYSSYGGEFCYLSTIVLRIYAFVIPVGIVITVNFTIFALIFTTMMCQMKSTKVLKSNHKHILIFMKLCSITGIFWSFGFIYEATRIAYFQYMFTVLNGGQGFFLMWSFIINKRVLHLYIHRSKQYVHKLQEWTAVSAIH